MKITKRYKNDENPVLAFEESDKEEMIKIGRKAEGIWYQKWVDLGKNDHGSCCGGKGIKVYFRGKGQRYARLTLIAKCDWIQGNVSAQESKDDAIGYLADHLKGIKVWYSDGYMD
jgi:hypothetical protein